MTLDELIRISLEEAAENTAMTVEQKNELLLGVLTQYLSKQIVKEPGNGKK